jgi:hypothetical protein
LTITWSTTRQCWALLKRNEISDYMTEQQNPSKQWCKHTSRSQQRSKWLWEAATKSTPPATWRNWEEYANLCSVESSVFTRHLEAFSWTMGMAANLARQTMITLHYHSLSHLP